MLLSFSTNNTVGKNNGFVQFYFVAERRDVSVSLTHSAVSTKGSPDLRGILWGPINLLTDGDRFGGCVFNIGQDGIPRIINVSRVRVRP